jgi:hypothetical protein
VPGLALFVLLVAGYLGSTFAMRRTKTATAHRRVAALFGYAVVAGLVIDLIAGPILGAYADVGHNFWPLWGEFTFIVFAVALLAATLQSLIGPIGTLVTVIIVVFIGNPSTGGVNGSPTCPFWQALGWPIRIAWLRRALTQRQLTRIRRLSGGGRRAGCLRQCALQNLPVPQHP